jgi:hypothetical protein
MPSKDPLQFNKNPVKKGINWIFAGLIVCAVIAFAEFIIILNLTVLKTEETTEVPVITEEYTEVYTTEEVTEEYTEEIPEEIATPEDATPEDAQPEDVTEEATEEQPVEDDLTLREYYPLFASFFETYSGHQLRTAVDNSYLLQLRDVIFTQTLQTAGVDNEDDYWLVMMAEYGENLGVTGTPVQEVILDQSTIDSLASQLSGYDFCDAIEQAASVSIKEVYYDGESDNVKLEMDNTYIVIKVNGEWWIAGKQAQ